MIHRPRPAVFQAFVNGWVYQAEKYIRSPIRGQENQTICGMFGLIQWVFAKKPETPQTARLIYIYRLTNAYIGDGSLALALVKSKT